MNPQEELLRLVADNPPLFEAVKRVITDKFQDRLSPEQNSMTDEQLGQITRARLEGLRKVEEAFKEIMRLKTPSKPQETRNPAR